MRGVRLDKALKGQRYEEQSSYRLVEYSSSWQPSWLYGFILPFLEAFRHHGRQEGVPSPRPSMDRTSGAICTEDGHIVDSV